MKGIIQSSRIHGKFLMSGNMPKVNAYCPIDGTQLAPVIRPDLSNYFCATCGAKYEWGDEDPDSLRGQAVRYVVDIKRRVEDKSKELAKLEKIIEAAQANGIL